MKLNLKDNDHQYQASGKYLLKLNIKALLFILIPKIPIYSSHC